MKELSLLVHKRESGQLLIEILISLFILILVVSGVLVGATASVRNSSFARNKSLANQYAQECLEKARQIRETAGFSAVTSGCCACANVSIFTRSLRVDDISSTEKKVTVTVSWSEGGKSYSTKLTTILTDWR